MHLFFFMVIDFVGTLCLLLSEYCAILIVSEWLHLFYVYISFIARHLCGGQQEWDYDSRSHVAVPIPIATYFRFHSHKIFKSNCCSLP